MNKVYLVMNNLIISNINCDYLLKLGPCDITISPNGSV